MPVPAPVPVRAPVSVPASAPTPRQLSEPRKVTVPKEKNIVSPKEIIVQSGPSGILEIDFDLGNLSDVESIKIKDRNEVYYKMYQDAIDKAKEARALAISTYLDAKQIQKLYMLDEIADIHELSKEII